MWKSLVVAALVALSLGVTDAQAGWRRYGRNWYYYPDSGQAAVQTTPAAPAPPATRAPVQARVPQRAYSYAPSPTPWPYYPNYGNWEGTAYSPAATLRPGQVYGTFGLRPADARARGNY